MQPDENAEIFAGVPPLKPIDETVDGDAAAASGEYAVYCEIVLDRMSPEALLHHAKALQQRCLQLEGENKFLEWEFRDFQQNLTYFSRAVRLAHELTTSNQDAIVDLAIAEVPHYFRCEYAALYLYNLESMRFELHHSTCGHDCTGAVKGRDSTLSKLFTSRSEPFLAEVDADDGCILFDDGERYRCEVPQEWVECMKGKMLVLPLQVGQLDTSDPLSLGGLLLGNSRGRLGTKDAEAGAFFCDLLSSSLYNAQLVAKLNDLIIIDPLTQIYNRRHLISHLDTAMIQARRQGHPLSVAMVDIDYFKLFNDRYGHICGDEVLREVAKVMKSSIRAGVDAVARYGGEEFILVMPFTPLETAVDVADRIRKTIKSHGVVFENQELTVTCSFGVAEYIPGESLEKMVNRADASLYQAKNNGRNRVCAASVRRGE